MIRLLPTLLIVLAFQLTALGQQLPLYTQYSFNPYLINPSLVASANQHEINLLYRQQWTAQSDGPQTLQFDGQYSLNGKMGLGLQVVNDKTVLLSSTSAMLTYGYRVQLATDHTLGFGLSAGMFINQVRLDQVAPADLLDPALLNVRNNNTAVDGQFGLHYRFKNFLFGASLVNLFDRKALTSEKFQTFKISQLKNDIFFASYRFNIVPETWFVQPNFAYRLNTNQPNFFEASATVSFKNLIELGGGYRQDFGPTSMLRVNIGHFQAGLAYDFPSPNAQVSTGGTREIHLKWRFGEVAPRPGVLSKKKSIPASPVVENTPPQQKQETVSTPVKEEEKPLPEPVKQEPKEEPKQEEVKVVEQPTVEQPKLEEPPKEEPKPEVKETPPPVVQQVPVSEPGVEYQLVVGTYTTRANAETFYNELVKKKLKPEISEETGKNGEHYFYVHLPSYKSKDVTLEKVLEIQKTIGVKDAWYRKIE